MGFSILVFKVFNWSVTDNNWLLNHSFIENIFRGFGQRMRESYGYRGVWAGSRAVWGCKTHLLGTPKPTPSYLEFRQRILEMNTEIGVIYWIADFLPTNIWKEWNWWWLILCRGTMLHADWSDVWFPWAI